MNRHAHYYFKWNTRYIFTLLDFLWYEFDNHLGDLKSIIFELSTFIKKIMASTMFVTTSCTKENLDICIRSQITCFFNEIIAIVLLLNPKFNSL